MKGREITHLALFFRRIYKQPNIIGTGSYCTFLRENAQYPCFANIERCQSAAIPPKKSARSKDRALISKIMAEASGRSLSQLPVIQIAYPAAFHEPTVLYREYFAADKSLFPVRPCDDFVPHCYQSVTSL